MNFLAGVGLGRNLAIQRFAVRALELDHAVELRVAVDHAKFADLRCVVGVGLDLDAVRPIDVGATVGQPVEHILATGLGR